MAHRANLRRDKGIAFKSRLHSRQKLQRWWRVDGDLWVGRTVTARNVASQFVKPVDQTLNSRMALAGAGHDVKPVRVSCPVIMNGYQAEPIGEGEAIGVSQKRNAKAGCGGSEREIMALQDAILRTTDIVDSNA